MKKKILAWLLCAVMVGAMLPAPMANAADGMVCEIVGGSQYDTLDKAFSHVESGDTIRLLSDIDNYSGMIPSEMEGVYYGMSVDGIDITFDLNGHDLNIVNPSGAALIVKHGGSVFLTGPGEFNVDGVSGVVVTFPAEGKTSSVTVTNITSAESGALLTCRGSVTVRGSIISEGDYGVLASDNSAGSVTVEGDVTTTGGGIGAYALYDNTILIKGSVSASGDGSRGTYAATGGHVHVEGGVTVSGNDSYGAFATNGGNITIDGNAGVTGTGCYGAYAYGFSNVSVEGDLTVSGTGVGAFASSGSEITIDGDISAATYIKVGGSIKAAGDYSATESGYHVYTESGDPKNTAVKVKAVIPTTFVLSNEEGGLIDKLIAAGMGKASLYHTLVKIQGTSGGVITDDFLDALASNPPDSEIFIQTLNDYAGLNGGVAINTDGTVFTTTAIRGRDYHGDTGYSTYPSDISGEGREIFTYADSAAYYIDAESGGAANKVFAIGWSAAAAPSVSTGEILDLTATGALVLGEVTGDGGAAVTDRGVVYAVTPDPTTATGTTVQAVAGVTGTYSAVLAGLAPNTTYYARTYATNAAGTAYGASRSFRTPVSVTTVAVGSMPKQAAVNKVTNKIYVPNNLGNSVTVIDGATDAVLSTVSLGSDTRPYFAAVNETTNKIYIANNFSNSVSVIDGATDTVEATVPTGAAPRAIAINETTNMIYVANYIGSTVTVINGADDTVSTTLNVGAGTRPTSLAIHETTNKLYSANYWNNTISVIDCATCTVEAVIPASPNQDSPRFVAINEQTNRVYVANFRSKTVTVIDGTDNSYAHVTVGVDPWEIAVCENTNTIYVTTDGEDAVAVIDGATNAVRSVPAGKSPQTIAVNPVTNMVYAGNYSSDDRSAAGFVVTQIDGATLETVGFADASNPSFLAVNERTNKVYGVNSNNTVTIIALEQPPALTVAGTAADDTAILQIDNKTPSARDKTWELSVTSGTVKAGVSASDVTLTGLPAGLDYTAAKGAGNNIVITLTGEAEAALAADADITAVIKGSAVTEAGAQDSAGISLKLWYVGPGTTFVISNEAGGYLIDKLIAAGHGNDTLYEVLELLQPDFSGAITERFMKTLLSTSANSDIFNDEATLINFAGLNNPVCINADGTLSIQPIFGRDLYGHTGYTTTGSNLGWTVWVTAADSHAYYVNAGIRAQDGEVTHYYKAFAILWMPELPAVTTDTVDTSGVTRSSAAVSGSVTDAGTASVTERGFVYGASANPTTANSKLAAGAGTGAFSATLTGLASGTAYHVRAYAISGAGTAYGEDRTFTTLSGGGGGGSTTKTKVYNADVKEGGFKTDTLPVAVSGSGGTASLDAAKATALFDAADASVVMPAIPGVSAYSLELPASALSADQKGGALELTTGFGSVAIPDNMLGNLTDTGGKTAGITIARGDTSGLTDAEKAAVGSHPLVQLTMTLGGIKTEWNNPAAPVTVTIPYTPTAEELKNSESLIIWYLDGSGRPVCVPNGHYDAATGSVTFTTSHFSLYAVGYNPVSFNDVALDAWYYDAVSFIGARGITDGTGNGNYSPDTKLTRSEFIVLLMRAYGIAPDVNPTDNFGDAGNTWYTGYLAAAKRLGIASGVGNNMFAPSGEITRQETFTLLYNALKVNGQIPKSRSIKTLSDFSDADRIASWAKDAMKRLVETGIVSGDGGKLSPEETSTRAEMAQLLYNLLGR